MAVSGKALGMAVAGGVLLWTGLTSPSGNPKDVLGQLLAGKKPAAPSSQGGLQVQAAGSAAIPAGGQASTAQEKANQAMGALMVSAVWPGQFSAFNSIVMAESGWNQFAENPSGAYGIPQALPGSKMASAGADWRTNPRTQITWMIGYIKSGQAGGGQAGSTPDSVWAFHQAHGWY